MEITHWKYLSSVFYRYLKYTCNAYKIANYTFLSFLVELSFLGFLTRASGVYIKMQVSIKD